MISQHDRGILRELAKKQIEYAHSEANQMVIRQWVAHNACQGVRPMIHLELGTFQDEVIPERMRCEGEAARSIEHALYHQFLNHELFHDDHPVLDYYPLTWQTRMIPFGIDVKVQHAQSGIGHQFEHQIKDLEEDFYKLAPSQIEFDREKVLQEKELLETIFGDILPVKMVMNCLYSVPTQDLVHIMGMETLFISMLDYPDLFHEMMERYTQDTLTYFRFLEKEGLICSTVAGEGLAQGSWCYTQELPTGNGAQLNTQDVWGFLDSQETVSISPEMYGAFIFPYYQRIANEYGMLSYGCCEPVHPIYDEYISKLINLRKISISAWCDEEMMGERLRGRKTIYHRKPSPNFLGVGATMDEDGLRQHIDKTLCAAKGCSLEITQRDVYTIHHDIAKARRFVEIIREEIDRLW